MKGNLNHTHFTHFSQREYKVGTSKNHWKHENLQYKSQTIHVSKFRLLSFYFNQKY